MSDSELRVARRERVFAAMREAAFDVLVLGRRDSVAYATGARSLWTAGTRPFGPAAVLVAATGDCHLLSTWDEGVPPDVPFEHLYGVTWNPAVMAAALAAIPGLASARRVGVDALSPGFARAAARLAPESELVAADDMLRAVRASKLPGELDRIRAAVQVARDGVEAASDALRSGADADAALTAAILRLGERGSTVPTSGPVVRPVPDSGDSLVAVDVAVLVDGYEGALGHTVALDAATADQRATVEAADEAHRRLVAACRPGAGRADLTSAAAGVPAWMVRGSGMGFEPPVLSASLDAGPALAVGMVLSVEVDAFGVRRRDLVTVGERATTSF